jgi:hypothetical protein
MWPLGDCLVRLYLAEYVGLVPHNLKIIVCIMSRGKAAYAMTYLTVVGPTCAGKTKFTRPLIEQSGFEAINMDRFSSIHFSDLGLAAAILWRHGGTYMGL